MKILIISYEAWCNTNNGGNVLSNIFEAFPDDDIAQIYCSGETPGNSICKKYFQISDSMLLTREKGKRLEVRSYAADYAEPSAAIENKINNRIPKVFKSASLLVREVLWTAFNWRTKELESFITEFAPDIIFAPCYAYYHVTKLALYVKSIANCPMISYISDDNYTLKHLNFYPSFWINKLITRKWIRRFFPECSLVYTMTQIQKREYEELFNRPMKILCKSADFEYIKKNAGSPISFIYAGNLHLNRWKVLAELAKSIAEVNGDKVKARLDVFSGTQLKQYQIKKLNDGKNVIFHGQIPYSELEKRYRESDIAVFTESFDLRNRMYTRLSFSTKIIDCLSSGCAVLAVGPEDQGGMAYLKDNDAAICVNDINDLTPTIKKITDNPSLIIEYSKKANQLGKQNHNKENIGKELRQDFNRVAEYGQP